MLQLFMLRYQGIYSADQLFQQPHIQAQMQHQQRLFMAEEERKRAIVMAQLQAQTFQAMEHERRLADAEAMDRLARLTGTATEFHHKEGIWAADVRTKALRIGGSQGDHMTPKSFTARALQDYQDKTGTVFTAAQLKAIGAHFDERYPDSLGSSEANDRHSVAEKKVLMSKLMHAPYDMTRDEMAHANWAALAAKDKFASMPAGAFGADKAALEQCYKDVFSSCVDPTGHTPLDYAKW